MKYLFVSIFLSFAFKVNAQWDSLQNKTVLVYSYWKGDIVDYYGTIKKRKPETVISIAVDTIVHLKGQNRKLIVFSKCMDEILFGMTYPIIQGEYDITKDSNNCIIGHPVLDQPHFSSSSKVTAIYQINYATYLLTLSKDIFYTRFRDPNFIKNIDNALLIDAEYHLPQTDYYQLKPYIKIGNFSYPLHPFVTIKNHTMDSVFNSAISNLYYRDEFLHYQSYKQFPSKFYRSADFYSSIPYKGEILYRIYLSAKYGIVESKGVGGTKKAGTYANILELKKVELPSSSVSVQ